MWGQGVLPNRMILAAVGWLGDRVPSEGETPAKCISLLWEAYKTRIVISDGSAGWHDCELCQGEQKWYPGGEVGPIIEWQGGQQRIYGHGHFLIRHNNTVFLSPVLILHYILDHGYKPPEVFIEAGQRGEFLSLEDLKWAKIDGS